MKKHEKEKNVNQGKKEMREGKCIKKNIKISQINKGNKNK